MLLPGTILIRLISLQLEYYKILTVQRWETPPPPELLLKTAETPTVAATV